MNILLLIIAIIVLIIDANEDKIRDWWRAEAKHCMKMGRNPPNTSSCRPPPPKGSGESNSHYEHKIDNYIVNRNDIEIVKDYGTNLD